MGCQHGQLYRIGRAATTEDFSNAVEGDGLETSLSGGMAVDGEEAGGSRTEEKSDASHVGMGSSEKRKHGLSPQKR